MVILPVPLVWIASVSLWPFSTAKNWFDPPLKIGPWCFGPWLAASASDVPARLSASTAAIATHERLLIVPPFSSAGREGPPPGPHPERFSDSLGALPRRAAVGNASVPELECAVAGSDGWGWIVAKSPQRTSIECPETAVPSKPCRPPCYSPTER